ncbi:M15 family metallopeptidase [Frigoribacterium sp. PhB116]|uniref:M15 family metallopeptidase n=1 Tax=Frigoribacterium sp. PhB116 TaxID=2485174 RepID=UPI0010D9D9F1|nr:M15 family metallopeptidase [Frigoribacterium sp. PhB116]TDT62264.1 D-alanyl-D-alanine carboxypeptidase-like protein [Frigoribacterium sp. PhB116]
MSDTAPLPIPAPRAPLAAPAEAPAPADASAPGRRRLGARDLTLMVAAAVLLVAALVAAAWAGVAFSGGTPVGGGSIGGRAGDSGAAGPVDGAVLAGDGDPSRDQDATGVAGGVVPDGTSAFDVDVPGLAGLDPRLLDALQRAATDASSDGVDVVVNSGWRSAAHQEQLLRDAVAQYGSAREAARWVATPATSAHVSGDAVDIGSWDATDWFSRNGASYDLCQVYENETWHYELRDGASRNGCPPMYRDPTEDPRMRA